MSIKYILNAMESKIGSSARKLVLIKLADNANDDGECFPSYQHIADHCEMSKRSVINHTKKLEDDGFLSIIERKTKAGTSNRSNVFKLSMGSAKSAPPSENPAPPPSAKSAPITCHSLEPVTEPKENTKKNTFSIPSESETLCFAELENLNINGFFDYYESNGWMVGKNKMKNWQAAARGWSKRQGGNNGTSRNQAIPKQPDNSATRHHDRLKALYAEAIAEELGSEAVQ